MPNPWDAGSARLLTSVGLRSPATTSAGCCRAGKRDSMPRLPEPRCCERLRDRRGDALTRPADLATLRRTRPIPQTIRLRIGFAGGSIEDAIGAPRRTDLSVIEAGRTGPRRADAARDLRQADRR